MSWGKLAGFASPGAGNFVGAVRFVRFLLFVALGVFFQLLVESDFALRAENVLAEVGEEASFFQRDAVLDELEGDLSEEAMDVFGG